MSAIGKAGFQAFVRYSTGGRAGALAHLVRKGRMKYRWPVIELTRAELATLAADVGLDGYANDLPF
jgi:hypothetical protein